MKQAINTTKANRGQGWEISHGEYWYIIGTMDEILHSYLELRAEHERWSLARTGRNEITAEVPVLNMRNWPNAEMINHGGDKIMKMLDSRDYNASATWQKQWASKNGHEYPLTTSWTQLRARPNGEGWRRFVQPNDRLGEWIDDEWIDYELIDDDNDAWQL